MGFAFPAMRRPVFQDEPACAVINRPVPFAEAEEGAGFKVGQVVSHGQAIGIWPMAPAVTARRAVPRAAAWPTAMPITIRAQAAVSAS